MLALLAAFHLHKPYGEREFPDLWREQIHHDVQRTGRHGEQNGG